MNDPNSYIRVQEMRAFVLLSKGHRQTEVARILGSHQSRIARIVKTLEHAYGINLFTGATGAKRINDEGMALAARFESALIALEGTSIAAEVRRKVASLRVAIKELSEIADSI